jgi:hypothetical protein
MAANGTATLAGGRSVISIAVPVVQVQLPNPRRCNSRKLLLMRDATKASRRKPSWVPGSLINLIRPPIPPPVGGVVASSRLASVKAFDMQIRKHWFSGLSISRSRCNKPWLLRQAIKQR